LPPAVVISTVNAGFSRALPCSAPAPAVNAWQSPTSDGDGEPCGSWPLGPLDLSGLSCAALLAAVGLSSDSGLGMAPVLAARAAPPAPAARTRAPALMVSSFASAVLIIDHLHRGGSSGFEGHRGGCPAVPAYALQALTPAYLLHPRSGF